MEQPETPPEMARRFIAEGEERCSQLTKFLEEKEAHSPPRTLEAAERLLAMLDSTLATMREHLKQEEELLRQGGA